jgi:arylsulfatase A-like enzyme
MPTLLVTVDALRADHLSQYGYERRTMPALDRVADEGTVFEAAFANAPYTRISIPSFMASQHLAYRSLQDFPTIPTVLAANGIRTAVVGTQTGIGLVDGDFGFEETIDLGRDEYHDESIARHSIGARFAHHVNRGATQISRLLQWKGADRLYRLLEAPYNAVFGNSGFSYSGYTSAEAVTDRALEWVRANADTDFFLWLHYMEGHRPYGVHDTDHRYTDQAPSRDRIRELMTKAGERPGDVSASERNLLVDLYDSDLRYCSRHLDRLFDGLVDDGIWEDCTVLFTSDHGEEFREHGKFFHRNYPYDELSHVPLLTRLPERTTPARVDGNRELLDLAPTIVDSTLDAEPATTFEGQNLFEGDSRTVFSLGQPNDASPAVTVRTDEWKLVESDETTELYSLESDPAESRDLSETRPDRVASLRDCIPRSLLERDVEPPRAPEDEVDRQQLEALGYMELRD